MGLASADETPSLNPDQPDVQLAPAVVVAAGADALDPRALTRLTAYTTHFVEHGTGFVLEDGSLVTVAHAVSDARGIGLGFGDNPLLIDLAPQPERVSISRLHDLARIDLGDLDLSGVVAARASLGDHAPSVGSVVALGGVPVDGRLEVEVGTIIARTSGVNYGLGRPDVYVIDTPVDVGWSGGPVVDDRGDVVAVIVAVETVSGVTLAVPVEHLPG